MNLRPHVGLTFDDVLLVPKRSAIKSRSLVSTSTYFSRGIQIAVPIVSANMDTVTEAPMAIAMARAGGIGVIHRFMPIKKQALQISRVKRVESFIVEDPLVISADAKVSDARQMLEDTKVGGLGVLDSRAKLIGLITTRDILLETNLNILVKDVMTTLDRLVTAPVGISMEEARAQLHKRGVEKLPLVDEHGTLQGMITTKDIIKLEKHPDATKDEKGRLRVAAAVGVRDNDFERALACVNAGADALVVDIAHGHSDMAIKMVQQLKRRLPDVDVIAGNVATPEGVHDLASVGADGIKVGVGPGSTCVTRSVTGFGVPQLTAVSECSKDGQASGVPILADGGIRTSGDIVKALGAGASAVMVGSLLAGTDESPGAVIVRGGRRYKIVRGMASLTANIHRREIDGHTDVHPTDLEQVIPEGVEAIVPYRGGAKETIIQLVGGLRSGLSYCGANTIQSLWESAEFIRITPAGMIENKHHDVQAV